MSEEIVVPVLGESIVEATVSKWLKKSGDNVKADEPIVELETDKVNLEVPSPVTGVLSNIKTKEGETVKVGALLGIVTEGEQGEAKVIEKIKPNQDCNCWIMENDKSVSIQSKNEIPLGHKIAMIDLNEGDTILKYGHDIGKVVKNIKKGEHVHVHNVKTKKW